MDERFVRLECLKLAVAMGEGTRQTPEEKVTVAELFESHVFGVDNPATLAPNVPQTDNAGRSGAGKKKGSQR